MVTTLTPVSFEQRIGSLNHRVVRLKVVKHCISIIVPLKKVNEKKKRHRERYTELTHQWAESGRSYVNFPRKQTSEEGKLPGVKGAVASQ